MADETMRRGRGDSARAFIGPQGLSRKQVMKDCGVSFLLSFLFLVVLFVKPCPPACQVQQCDEKQPWRDLSPDWRAKYSYSPRPCVTKDLFRTSLRALCLWWREGDLDCGSGPKPRRARSRRGPNARGGRVGASSLHSMFLDSVVLRTSPHSMRMNIGSGAQKCHKKVRKDTKHWSEIFPE